ncbi:MAG TPA: adenylate/guanylate cyclase domain-containing protein [bacterium]|nr:adenylate/guanylate cyclase domain-containing protein [bacterium]
MLTYASADTGGGLMAKRKTKEIKKDKVFHRRVIISIGVIATFMAIGITSTGLLNRMENNSIDWRFKNRGPLEITAPVVIVAIDDESFARMPERWTWPRTFYAKAVDNLKKWGAKVVGFDVIYSETTARYPQEDAAFVDSVKRAGNVVLGTAVLYEETAAGPRTRALMPMPGLKEAAASLGLIQHVYDADSAIRRSYLLVDEGGDRHYSLSVMVLGMYKGLAPKDIDISVPELLKWGDMEVKRRRNMMYVNFTGPPSHFPTIPFHKVYFEKEADPSLFKDKIVLIGSTAEILHDVFITPFSTAGDKMPGVEVHANVINTIFSGGYITRMAPVQGFILLLALGIATSFMLFAIKAWQGLIVVAAEILLYIFAAQYIFGAYNYIVDFVNPIFTMAFCYVSISTYKVAVEEKEKRKIKSVFSKYMSEELVNELLKSTEIKLGGEKKDITVLFSDIRGFTAMSEKYPPEEVVALLNEYLSEMTDAVFVNKGMLDKFIGDAVMALFGTPTYYKDHALRAVKAAFLMRKKLAKLNEKWAAEGRPGLKIGIGINSGEVIAGNMGSIKRMEYTVIGDTVNLASRVETLNKELGTELLISGKTYERVKDRVKVKKYTEIKVKGKEEYQTVYEVTELV